MQRRWIHAILAGCSIGFGPALAEEWAVVGARQMGMGGAGVAVTRGAMSTYWNPAALSPPRAPRANTTWDVAIPFTVNGAAIGDVLDDVDDIADLVDDLGDFDDLEDKLDDAGQLLTDQELRSAIRLLTQEIPDLGEAGTGLVSNASLGVAARLGNFAFSALGILSAGGVTNVDLLNFSLGDEGLDGVVGAGNDRSGQLSPDGQAFADTLAGDGLGTQDQVEEVIFQAEQAGVPIDDPTIQANIEAVLQSTQDNIGGGVDNFFTQNATGVDLRGILVQEYGVSYAFPIAQIISIGVTTKLMYGTTIFKPFTLNNFEDTGDLLDEVLDFDEKEESLTYGLDVGVLVQPLPWLSLGVVGRNVNRPRFDFDGPGDYILEPQVRAGLGVVIPETGLTLALDVDVLENDSEALLDYESQSVSAGVEWAIFNRLMLRGGVSKNLSETNEDFALHGGLGFYLPYVSVDFAGMFVPDFTDVDGTDMPERAGASLFVGINVPLD